MSKAALQAFRAKRARVQHGEQQPEQTQNATDLRRFAVLQKAVSDASGIRAKNEIKKQGLETWTPYAEAYLEQDRITRNDAVAYTIMWLLDTGDIRKGTQLAVQAIQKGLPTPEPIKRNFTAFLFDSLHEYTTNVEPSDEDYHCIATALTVIAPASAEVADQPKAKAHKTLAHALLAISAETREMQRAMEACIQAEELVGENKARVKTLKKEIEKRITDFSPKESSNQQGSHPAGSAEDTRSKQPAGGQQEAPSDTISNRADDSASPPLLGDSE